MPRDSWERKGRLKRRKRREIASPDRLQLGHRLLHRIELWLKDFLHLSLSLSESLLPVPRFALQRTRTQRFLSANATCRRKNRDEVCVNVKLRMLLLHGEEESRVMITSYGDSDLWPRHSCSTFLPLGTCGP